MCKTVRHEWLSLAGETSTSQGSHYYSIRRKKEASFLERRRFTDLKERKEARHRVSPIDSCSQNPIFDRNKPPNREQEKGDKVKMVVWGSGGGEEEAEDYLFKVVIVGDSAVGKSNLLSRYARNEFDPHSKATIGVEFQTQSMVIEGKEVKAQIWDTAGQDRFRAVTSAYYRGAFGALVVYDVSRRSTFDSVARWLDELNTYNSDSTVSKMLVGNKCDLSAIREVSIEEGKRFAEAEGLFFMETSALNCTNVKTAFEIVIREIFDNVSRKVLNSDSYKVDLSLNRVTLSGDEVYEQKQDPSRFSCC